MRFRGALAVEILAVLLRDQHSKGSLAAALDWVFARAFGEGPVTSGKLDLRDTTNIFLVEARFF